MGYYAVRVEGGREVETAFKVMGLKVRDLSAAWDRIGAKIKRDAVPLTPVLTGALVASLRQGRTKSSATVRAGGARVPYAGPLNYGGVVSGYYGPHHIGPVHFLNRALEENEHYAGAEVGNEVMRIARQVGLK